MPVVLTDIYGGLLHQTMIERIYADEKCIYTNWDEKCIYIQNGQNKLFWVLSLESWVLSLESWVLSFESYIAISIPAVVSQPRWSCVFVLSSTWSIWRHLSAIETIGIISKFIKTCVYFATAQGIFLMWTLIKLSLGVKHIAVIIMKKLSHSLMMQPCAMVGFNSLRHNHNMLIINWPIGSLKMLNENMNIIQAVCDFILSTKRLT